MMWTNNDGYGGITIRVPDGVGPPWCNYAKKKKVTEGMCWRPSVGLARLDAIPFADGHYDSLNTQFRAGCN